MIYQRAAVDHPSLLDVILKAIMHSPNTRKHVPITQLTRTRYTKEQLSTTPPFLMSYLRRSCEHRENVQKPRNKPLKNQNPTSRRVHLNPKYTKQRRSHERSREIVVGTCPGVPFAANKQQDKELADGLRGQPDTNKHAVGHRLFIKGKRPPILEFASGRGLHPALPSAYANRRLGWALLFIKGKRPSILEFASGRGLHPAIPSAYANRRLAVFYVEWNMSEKNGSIWDKMKELAARKTLRTACRMVMTVFSCTKALQLGRKLTAKGGDDSRITAQRRRRFLPCCTKALQLGRKLKAKREDDSRITTQRRRRFFHGLTALRWGQICQGTLGTTALSVFEVTDDLCFSTESICDVKGKNVAKNARSIHKNHAHRSIHGD
uniref:DUF1156 domain-containing protein n=1 Tax=Steinernema glaseri TaxID=37863 RepID=A0A1I7YUV1_9BILA